MHTTFSMILINIKHLELDKIKIDKKSGKNSHIYFIGGATFKDLSYVKINSVNPLYLIFDKINRFIEEIN